MVIFIDHAALKYLLTKKDVNLSLIRWVLLLQEFDITIKDKKGVENVVADHLSRLTFIETEPSLPISYSFPNEHILSIEFNPWYVDIVNFLVTGKTPPHWTTQY